MRVRCKGCNYIFDDDEGRNCPECNWNVVELLGPLWVNVYLVDLAFGGREEGGWYYKVGEAIESIKVDTETEANQEADRLRRKHSNEGRRSIHSVLSEGEYEIRIEDRFAENFPKCKPYYE